MGVAIALVVPFLFWWVSYGFWQTPISEALR
jgi:hypothetical protein